MADLGNRGAQDYQGGGVSKVILLLVRRVWQGNGDGSILNLRWRKSEQGETGLTRREIAEDSPLREVQYHVALG